MRKVKFLNWFNAVLVKILPVFPKSFVWIFSRKYIAGIRLEDALEKTRHLNASGCCATIDLLGEEIVSLDEASSVKKTCMQILESIQQNGLDANLSLKLTGLGLRIDKEICFHHTSEIVQRAAQLNNFIRIDMEDSTTTRDTLDIYRRLRKRYRNVGAVIQAYLKRSPQDVRLSIENHTAQFRICKGIYDESPDIAYKDRQMIRDQFIKLVDMMLSAGAYVGIATHDREMVNRSLTLIKEKQKSHDDYEFQMLLGVTEKLRNRLVSEGHRMRVYVPYGEQWYAYSMRRLKENPMLAGHIVKNLFIRG